MGTYNGVSTSFSNNIYIFEKEDLVLGGEDGTSNVPTKQLADNCSYLKKYTGRVITGSGAPTASTVSGFTLDADSVNNLLYLDTVTGAFWKLTNYITPAWTNTYTSAILNVNGLQLNKNGDEAQYFQLKYNSVDGQLELKDNNNLYSDLRVNKLYFNSLNAIATDISNITDNEILLLSDNTTSAENANGLFSVKRLKDILINITGFDVGVGSEDTWYTNIDPASVGITTSYQCYVQINDLDEATGEIINGYYVVTSVNSSGPNYSFNTSRTFNPIVSNTTSQTGLNGTIALDDSAIVKWVENSGNGYFELVTRTGTLLPINCGGFFINNVPLNFIADRVISTQAQFDELFKATATGGDVHYFRTPESGYTVDISNQYIYIKANSFSTDGSYELSNIVEILGDNIKIESAPSVKIKLMNNNSGFRFKNNTIMNVQTWGTNYFNVDSEDTYYERGEQIQSQVPLAINDVIYSFSNSGPACKKNTITDIIKNAKQNFNIQLSNSGNVWGNYDDIEVKNDATTNPNTGITTSSYFEIGTDKYYVVFYKNSGVIKYNVYQFDFTTKNYEFVRTVISDDSLTNLTSMTTTIVGNYIFLFAASSDSNKITNTLLSTLVSTTSDPFTFIDVTSSLTDFFTYFSYNVTATTNIRYIAYITGTTLKCYTTNTIGTPDPAVWYNLDSLAETVYASTKKISLLINGSDIYISFCNSSGFISIAKHSGSSWTIYNNVDGGTNTCGIYSSLILRDGHMYIVYDYLSTELKFAELTTSGTLQNSQTFYSNSKINNVDIFDNTYNEIPSNTDLVQLYAIGTTPETLDFGTTINAKTSSFAIDSNNHLHSAEAIASYLKYSLWNGTWSTVTINAVADANMAKENRIKLSSTNVPYIASRYANSAIRVYYPTSYPSTWTYTNIAAVSSIRCCDYNMNTSNHSYVAYLENVGGTSYQVKCKKNTAVPPSGSFTEVTGSYAYAFTATNDWYTSTDQSQLVQLVEVNGANPKMICIDFSKPSTTYNINLNYLYYNGSSWNTPTLGTTQQVITSNATSTLVNFVCAKMGTDGIIHIVYNTTASGTTNIYYAKVESGVLSVPTFVTTVSGTFQSLQLGLDNNNKPLITISNTTSYYFVYYDATYDWITYSPSPATFSELFNIYTKNNFIDVMYKSSSGTNPVLFNRFALNDLETQVKSSIISLTSKDIEQTGGNNFDETQSVIPITATYSHFGGCGNNQIMSTINDGSKNYVLKHNYNLQIFTNKDTLSTASNYILSPDFIENQIITLNFTSDFSVVVEDCFDISNTIMSQFNSRVTDAIGTNCFSGYGKVYGNSMEININSTNSFTNNLHEINHTTFLKSVINIGIQTGDQNFSDCYNIAFVGIVDDSSFIGEGDFNI